MHVLVIQKIDFIFLTGPATISKGQYFSGFSQWENIRFAAESEKERDGYTANYVSPT